MIDRKDALIKIIGMRTHIQLKLNSFGSSKNSFDFDCCVYILNQFIFLYWELI